MLSTWYGLWIPWGFAQKKKVSGDAVKSEIMSNQELTKQLYKPNIKIINYFTDMQLISKFQKGFRFILCVTDIYIYIYIYIYTYIFINIV